MTKYEWETELKKCMTRLPKAEQDRVLAYYNELFADRADDGMSEKQIINEFGNPVDVAFKIMTEYGMDERAPDDERKIAPPDFYSKKNETFVTPPDFWAGKSGKKAAAPKNDAKAAKDEKEYLREEREQRRDIRREDRAARREDRRESKKHGGGATAAFLLELLFLGWLFLTVAIVAWSLVISVYLVGFSFAAGTVYSLICVIMPGATVAARLVEFAAMLLMLGIALMILPNIGKIGKFGVKVTGGLWNGMFGWYTKRDKKADKRKDGNGSNVRSEVA